MPTIGGLDGVLLYPTVKLAPWNISRMHAVSVRFFGAPRSLQIAKIMRNLCVVASNIVFSIVFRRSWTYTYRRYTELSPSFPELTCFVQVRCDGTNGGGLEDNAADLPRLVVQVQPQGTRLARAAAGCCAAPRRSQLTHLHVGCYRFRRLAQGASNSYALKENIWIVQYLRMKAAKWPPSGFESRDQK